ncbi:PAS domain-containing protein [Sphingomonas aliaeris]|uniref:histidine kinase n=1 Tax=Sphingomonas aliaeris TaxID=2759526 RepID=A0A974S4U3_9SPHN|nr:PAS domain-containing protein [Sphingomonas aliaeris]QQV77952.1 PAS domain-containing protein [Sphingomonas aliaeris]
METLTLDGGESNEHPEPTSASFLAGGGAMGQIIRAYDWTSTPLGNPTGWPQGLRTVVQILLNTGHPMYIWWGPGLTCIYNDAYSRSIGPEMHPASLGKPAQSVWAEIWGTIGPQIEQVMSGGGPTWHENQLVPITRNGRREDVYWTYSYSPIGDDFALHGVGGVLVVCTETTPTIISEKRSRAELERQKRLFEEAPGFIAILRGEGHVFEFANRAYERLSGGRAVLGLPVREAFPEIEGQGFFEHLDRVYQSGEPFTAAHVPIRLEESDGFRLRYIDYIYAPVTDDKGAVTGIFVEGHDVTDAYLAERALRQSEERFRSFAETSTDTLWIVNAETGQLEYLSPAYENTWGEPRDAAMSDIGHWAERLHPGDREAALSALSKLRAGERHSIEYRIVRPDGEVRYIHDSGFPIYEAGRIRRMAGVAQDLTGFRLAERRLADNERWTRTLLEGFPRWCGERRPMAPGPGPARNGPSTAASCKPPASRLAGSHAFTRTTASGCGPCGRGQARMARSEPTTESTMQRAADTGGRRRGRLRSATIGAR